MNGKLGRIGVILGGISSEREISLKTGKAVYDALVSSEQDVVSIDIKDAASVKENISREKIDIAFIALHGRFGEDGAIQTILEEMKIPYTGSGPQASRLALNKILSRKIFRSNSIPVPRSKVLNRSCGCKSTLKEFSFPFVVKPANEGSSIGMSIVEKKTEVIRALDDAFLYDEEILIEEYIAGEDITVGILNDEVLPVLCIRPKAKFYDFRAKYTSGMAEYIVPAPFSKDITKEAQRLGLLAHQVLGCRSFSRVDMLLDKEGRDIIVLEVNTIPGLTSSSLLPKAAAAAGISFEQMCLAIIESALVKDQNMQRDSLWQ